MYVYFFLFGIGCMYNYISLYIVLIITECDN